MDAQPGRDRGRRHQLRSPDLASLPFCARSETVDNLHSPEYRAAMTSLHGLATTRELVVLDFETTGLVPAFDRTIEVAATLLVDHRPV